MLKEDESDNLSRRRVRFFFFSREEERLHVQVHCADGEAKFWLEPQIELAQNYGLNDRRVRRQKHLFGNAKMTSVLRGAGTSDVEVTNVSNHGFWLLLGLEELFVPFSEFPWFKDASIAQIMKVDRPQPHHLYWPDLDVDVSVDSIRHPDRFPLVSRART